MGPYLHNVAALHARRHPYVHRRGAALGQLQHQQLGRVQGHADCDAALAAFLVHLCGAAEVIDALTPYSSQSLRLSSTAR